MKSHNFLEKQFATCVASLVFWHGIKCAIFENLSTTTKWNQILFVFLAVPTQNPCLLHPKASLVWAMVDTIQCSIFYLFHVGRFFIYSRILLHFFSYLANSMNCSNAQMSYHGRNVQPILHYVFPSKGYPSLSILLGTIDFPWKTIPLESYTISTGFYLSTQGLYMLCMPPWNLYHHNTCP